MVSQASITAVRGRTTCPHSRQLSVIFPEVSKTNLLPRVLDDETVSVHSVDVSDVRKRSVISGSEIETKSLKARSAS
jgi:hypothetical protein